METLFAVLTITEIAQLWRKHPVTVRRALDARRNPLVARKSPDNEQGIWLISYDSCVRRWGQPPAA